MNYAECKESFPGGLSGLEVYWRDRYDWLKSLGYELRLRYKPDWVPSWQGSKKSQFDSEDGVYLRVRCLSIWTLALSHANATMQVEIIIDAIRTKDGTIVVIKRILKSVHPYESEIGRFLSSSPLTTDPRNHCCPILDVLDDPEDSDVQLIVMPMLRRYYEPKLATVGEAMEMFRQLFEVPPLTPV